VTVINWTVVGRTKLTALATVECSADELGRVVYHTERPLLYASEAGWAHRASPSATADILVGNLTYKVQPHFRNLIHT